MSNNMRVKYREFLDKKIQDVFSSISDDKLIKKLQQVQSIDHIERF